MSIVVHLPYKKDFEPIVRMDENVGIPEKVGKYKFYKVLYVEPVQPVIIAETLNALEKNKERSLDELKLEENEFGQWRMWIPDFVSVEMNYPRASTKWLTKSVETNAIPLSMAKENVLEFFTIKDDVPVLYLTNPVNEGQTVRLIFWGFKFVIEELKEIPEKYTPIPVYSAAALKEVR